MTRYLVNISRWIDSTPAQVGDAWTQTVVLLPASSQVDAAGASQLRLICNFLLSRSQCGCKVCLVLPHGHTTTVCAVGSVKVLLLCSLHRWCARRQRFRSAGVCHGPSGVVFSVLRWMLKETAHAFRGCASFCFFFFLYICFMCVCHCWSFMSCDVFGAKTEPRVFLFVCASGHSRGIPQYCPPLSPVCCPDVYIACSERLRC